MIQLLFRKVYYDGIQELPEGRQLEAYNAIMKYSFTGDVPEHSNECAPLLTMIFRSIDEDRSRYEKRCREGD